MVFYAQAAICQLYSGDEHEMDKINMQLGVSCFSKLKHMSPPFPPFAEFSRS